MRTISRYGVDNYKSESNFTKRENTTRIHYCSDARAVGTFLKVKLFFVSIYRAFTQNIIHFKIEN